MVRRKAADKAEGQTMRSPIDLEMKFSKCIRRVDGVTLAAFEPATLSAAALSHGCVRDQLGGNSCVAKRTN
jgi:hypothetical protein